MTIKDVQIHANTSPDTKTNPNANPNSSPTVKQLVTVNIQLNIVTCPSEKFIRHNVVALLVPTSIVIVTMPTRILPETTKIQFLEYRHFYQLYSL